MDKATFISTVTVMQPQYVPNDTVKAHLARVDLIAVVGPTGAGKNAIIDKSGFPYVLSDMTRVPRKHETDGIDANFRVDYDGLLREIQSGSFVQYVLNHNGEMYGTKDASYPPEGYCTFPIVADAIDTFRSLPFRKVIPVYIVPPSYEEMLRRSKKHHDTDMPIRLKEAKRSLEIAISDPTYQFILNEDLDQATAVFKEYIATQTMDPVAEKYARDVAVQLFANIQI